MNRSRACVFEGAMETGVRSSYAADVTGALEKLRQGNSDKSRGRNRNIKEAEDRRMRSLSPGLCRSYDWNTTHFYPDSHQVDGVNLLLSTHRGFGKTVRFASEGEPSSSSSSSAEEVEEEEEEEEEERGENEEEWRRDKMNEVKMEDEDRKEESEEYVSSSDDFDVWNPSSENENEPDRNTKRGCEPKIEATPAAEDREGNTQERRCQRGFPDGDGAPDPDAHRAKFGIRELKEEKLDRSRLRTESSQSVLDNNEGEVDDWKNNAADSEWRWEQGRRDYVRKNITVCENEEKLYYNWNQNEFIDVRPLFSNASKEYVTQLCPIGNSEHRAFKTEISVDLQKTETASKQVSAKEPIRRSHNPSCDRQWLNQNPKPHNGVCMVTHFDDLWPVSEFGSDYAEGRKALQTETPPQVREQCSPVEKSLRSILKHNKVPDVQTNRINNGSDPPMLPLQDPIRPQWCTLPNLHRFVGISPSCSAAVDDADGTRDHEARKATEDSNTDAPERRWNSESFLFLEDVRSRSQAGKRKRFIIDYQRPYRGHVTSARSGENRTIGPFTLNEFEQCLEIPTGQMHLKEVRKSLKEEEIDRHPKMEEIRMDRLGTEEMINGKGDPSSNRDTSSDLFWLFHTVSRGDGCSLKGPINGSTEFLPLNRSVATTAIFHPDDRKKSAYTSKYPYNYRKEVTNWKTGPALREQYRWSTAIREPHARILLDQWNVEPPLSVIPPRNRYRIVQPGQFLKKYQTTDVDSVRLNNSTNKNERAFTITGQPRASCSPFKNHSNERQPTTNYAVVGISRQDKSTFPPVRVSTDLQEEIPSTISPNLINQKHRYLRERVLTKAFKPELTAPIPADPILSRSDIAYHSLQNLEQLQLADVTSKHTSIYHETWDSHTSKSSLLSLPSDLLLRQRHVDMSSIGSQDSVERMRSDVRKLQGQRIQGRRGNACRVISPIRNSFLSQVHDASGEESTSERSSSEKMNSKENYGLRQFDVSNETEKARAAQDHRPKYLRTIRRAQQTPRTVKARHEMKARRVKSSDRSKEIIQLTNWNRHAYGPSYSSESVNIRR